jgi:hypothetical protein
MTMNVKRLQSILEEIVEEGDQRPDGWRAVFGMDKRTYTYDIYIINPVIGVYQIKMDHKNPYELRGVGGKIARKVDEEIMGMIGEDGNFGIIRQRPDEISNSLRSGISFEDIVKASIIAGESGYGMDAPVRGPIDNSSESINLLRSTFPNEKKRIELEFEKIAEEDGMYRSYT